MKIYARIANIMLTALVLVLSHQACQAAVLSVGKETIGKNALWSGEVLVTGDILIPPGVTLTIAPGTVVKFKKIDPAGDRNLFGTQSPYYPQAELIVTGRLVAQGTEQKPIIFTSAETNPQAADWGALNFLGGDGNILEWCRITYAYNGVHAHGAQVLVKQSELSKNAVAISVKKDEETPGAPGFDKEADLTVSQCLIRDNKGGINVRKSRAVITGNTISDNRFFGIWIKERSLGEIRRNEIIANQKGIFLFRAEGMTITENNIYSNLDYNLAIADEQEKDVPANGNWFGSVDVTKIKALIFDRQSDPSVAQILVEPFLTAPVKDAGRSKK